MTKTNDRLDHPTTRTAPRPTPTVMLAILLIIASITVGVVFLWWLITCFLPSLFHASPV